MPYSDSDSKKVRAFEAIITVVVVIAILALMLYSFFTGIMKETARRESLWLERCHSKEVGAAMRPLCDGWQCEGDRCCFPGLNYCVEDHKIVASALRR